MKSVKRIPAALGALLVPAAMAAFLLSPARYAESVLDGISLWAASVLPATFPFLFLTALFTRGPLYARLSGFLSPLFGKAFKVSGAGGGAALLSAVSGYPVGARTLSDLKKRGAVSEGELRRLSLLCSTSGPLFLAGTVGSIMYGSPRAGAILLFSHLAGVWLFCAVSARFSKEKFAGSPPPPPPRRDDALYGAVLSVLCVGGYIALFSCFSKMLDDTGLFALLASPFGAVGARYGEGVFRGLLEMTGGCALLSAIRTPLSLALSCFLTTFGGACVLTQQLTFLVPAGVKPLPFLGGKLAQAVLSGLICLGAGYVFGI